MPHTSYTHRFNRKILSNCHTLNKKDLNFLEYNFIPRYNTTNLLNFFPAKEDHISPNRHIFAAPHKYLSYFLINLCKLSQSHTSTLHPHLGLRHSNRTIFPPLNKAFLDHLYKSYLRDNFYTKLSRENICSL
jgi:hypothetical protein